MSRITSIARRSLRPDPGPWLHWMPSVGSKSSGTSRSSRPSPRPSPGRVSDRTRRYARRSVTTWIDLVDPTREELEASLGVAVDPDVIESLLAPSTGPREPRPLLEGHGSYVFGVLVPMVATPDGRELAFQEVSLVATRAQLLTVRKSSPSGAAYDTGPLHAAADAGVSVGKLVHRLVDDVTDSYLDLLDRIYASIDELEDEIEHMRPAEIRMGIADMRHELL